jgi:glutamine synthetase
MAQDIVKRAKDDGVRFISLQFTDVTGSVKSADIPVERLPAALDEGVWFDGSSVEGFARIQESDMRLVLEPDSYAVLPWSHPDRQRARVFCDIFNPDETPFAGDPRGTLKRVLKRMGERGWTYNIGPEPEFFLLRTNGAGSIHPVPHDVGGYFDFSASDEAQRVRAELMLALSRMGLEVEMGHHEVALGQHEIDFRYTDALRAADNVLTLKSAVKALAAQHGLVATFMPKPIFGINGSGMHTHQSIFDSQGDNLFFDANDPYRLSALAHGFIAGQLAHARALAAIVCPTVNSYKRIVPGYEAPVYVCWAQINRSALIRIPRASPGREKATRVELRCPDPSCNPYLAFAAMLSAGMDGVDKKMVASEPMNNVNLYEMTAEELAERKIIQLPGSLPEALSELEADAVLRAALGEEIYQAFHRAKMAEWDMFRIRVTDWEVETYLQVA